MERKNGQQKDNSAAVSGRPDNYPYRPVLDAVYITLSVLAAVLSFFFYYVALPMAAVMTVLSAIRLKRCSSQLQQASFGAALIALLISAAILIVNVAIFGG